MEMIVVRRCRFLTYELLRRTFGNDPNVEIIWDRRKADRRNAQREFLDNRRLVQRRLPPPVQWTRLDYLFTHGFVNSGLRHRAPLRSDSSE
jgi:hypothetical protein